MPARLTKVLLAASAPLYSSNTLEVTTLRGAPGVFVSSVRGRLSAAAARKLGDAALAQSAGDRRYLLMFHDWSEMTDYDPEARILLTDVARALLPVTDAIHLFSVSPVVTFGIRVANVILRKMTTHSSAFAFDAALEAALARPTRLRSG